MKYLLTIVLAFSVPTTVFFQATRIHSSGTLPTACSVGNVYIKTGSASGFYTCVTTNTWSGPLSALSSLTPALVANTIANASFAQTWQWDPSANNLTFLKLEETGTSTQSGVSILEVATSAGAAATPVVINCFNTSDLNACLLVNDVASDGSPFVVTPDGRVGIGMVSPTVPGLDILGAGQNTFFLVGNGSSSIGIEVNNASVQFKVSNDPLVFEFNGTDRLTFDAAGNIDALSFSLNGDTGHTGTVCSAFTGGLCTTGTAPGELTPDQQEIARLSASLAAVHAELSDLRALVRR